MCTKETPKTTYEVLVPTCNLLEGPMSAISHHMWWWLWRSGQKAVGRSGGRAVGRSGGRAVGRSGSGALNHYFSVRSECFAFFKAG